MKAHTQEFKNNIKEMGRELDSIISYNIDGETIELGNEMLNSVTPVFETSLLKSVMRELDIDSNVDIPLGTIINYKFGVRLNGSAYDYIDYGNYIVKSSEKQEDTNSYNIICYDKMLASMVPYNKLQSLETLEMNFPMTVRNYIDCVCADLGLFFKNKDEEFVNSERYIQEDLYAELGYNYRDVLDELAQVTASNIVINENDELEIRYINETNDIIDEEYLKDVNVAFGEKYGPINSIVLSRAAASDNVYLRDDESVEKNGLCELKIYDNQIMNFNDRSDYLPEILERLNGLEYHTNDFSSTGICYYDVCDKYGVKIGDDIYNCIMLNDQTNITQGLEELVYTELPEQAETDYTKADKTDIRINQTWIIANKNTGDITALTTRTTTIEDNLNNNYYTIEQSNELVQNAANGVTNTFSEAGGNNIFRNTGLWFTASSTEFTLFPSDNLYPSETTFMGNKVYYEFWNGEIERIKEDKAANSIALLLKQGEVNQEQEVPNGSYTISFKYKKLINLANVIVKINDIDYELTETNDTEFEKVIEVNSRHINVLFKSDINNSCEIYDLMVNAGKVKLAYSQNQNEVTTDTVNISKGITITSSNTETTFKANADGIRTLDKRGNVLTEFTDTGMTTKKMVVEDEAQMVGLLIQKVDNQTWFTKL